MQTHHVKSDNAGTARHIPLTSPIRQIIRKISPAIVFKALRRVRNYRYFIQTERASWVKLSWRKRLWAWRRGFISSDLLFFDFNKFRVEDFLPEFPYLCAHPLNGQFSALIDNKLNLRYILQPFSEYLPECYLLLLEGRTMRISDRIGEGPVREREMPFLNYAVIREAS